MIKAKKIPNTDFLSGTILLSLSVIITKLLGVGFKVPLSYILGDAGMGYFNTAYAIYGLFYILCTAGVPKSVMLVLSDYRVNQRAGVTDEYIVKCALRLFLKIGLFSSLLNIICAPVFASFVGNPDAALSILAVAPSILFVSLSGVLRGRLNDSEKLIEIAISQLIEGTIKLLLGLAFSNMGIRLGYSVSAISALAILGITAGSIISFIYLYIKTKKLNNKDNIWQKVYFGNKEISKRILKNSLPIALSASLLNLSSTLDLTMIIKRLVALGMTVEYANSTYGNYTTLAVPMFTLVISVLAPIATSFMPRLSKSYAGGNKVAFSESLNRLLLITLAISVPASLAMYFYSFDLLDILFSVQSSAMGAEMLIYLSLGICFLSALTVINTALESMGKIFPTVLSLIIGAAVKLAVTYFLIGTSCGINGAPIGSVISYFVSLVISIFALELNGTKTYALIKIAVLYSLGVIAFYIPFATVYSRNMFSSSLISALASITISLTAYFVFLLIVFLFVLRKSVLKMNKKMNLRLAE